MVDFPSDKIAEANGQFASVSAFTKSRVLTVINHMVLNLNG
jgi:hypothetical protein